MKIKNLFMKKDEGIDGILVTVGLCIIALLLCMLMRDELKDFITKLVDEMQAKSLKILEGNLCILPLWLL